MFSLAMQPHAAMGHERLVRQTLFIKRSVVKRGALPRRLFGGNSYRGMSGKNTRVAATPREAADEKNEHEIERESYRFEEMCTTTLIAAVSASAFLVRPGETATRPPTLGPLEKDPTLAEKKRTSRRPPRCRFFPKTPDEKASYFFAGSL
jgi:hypothetical protein